MCNETAGKAFVRLVTRNVVAAAGGMQHGEKDVIVKTENGAILGGHILI